MTCTASLAPLTCTSLFSCRFMCKDENLRVLACLHKADDEACVPPHGLSSLHHVTACSSVTIHHGNNFDSPVVEMDAGLTGGAHLMHL